jgi:hypothetical protein
MQVHGWCNNGNLPLIVEGHCCKEEGSEGRTGRKKEVDTQAQKVLTLGLDQIIKFIYCLDGPLGEGNVWCSNSECV